MNIEAILVVKNTTELVLGITALGCWFKFCMGLNFFQAFFSTMTSAVFITVRIASIFVSSTAVHIYDFSILLSLFTSWKVYLHPTL